MPRLLGPDAPLKEAGRDLVGHTRFTWPVANPGVVGDKETFLLFAANVSITSEVYGEGVTCLAAEGEVVGIGLDPTIPCAASRHLCHATV